MAARQLEAENELRHFLKLARPIWSKPRRRGYSDIALVIQKLRAIGVCDTQALVKRILENTINDDLVSNGHYPFSRDAIESIRKQIPFTRSLESADVPQVRQVGAFAPVPQMLSRRRLVNQPASRRRRDRVEVEPSVDSASSAGAVEGNGQVGASPSTGMTSGSAGFGGALFDGSAGDLSPVDDCGDLAQVTLRGASAMKMEKKAQIRRKRNLRLPGSLDPDFGTDRPQTTVPMWPLLPIPAELLQGSTGLASNANTTSAPTTAWGWRPTAAVVEAGAFLPLADRYMQPSLAALPAPLPAPLSASMPLLPRCDAASPSRGIIGGESPSRRPASSLSGLTCSSDEKANSPKGRGSGGGPPLLPNLTSAKVPDRPVSVNEVERLVRMGTTMCSGTRTPRWVNSRCKTAQQLGEEMLSEQQALDRRTEFRRQVKGENNSLRSHVAEVIRSRLREEKQRDSTQAFDFQQRCFNIRKNLASMTASRRDLSQLKLRVLSLNEEAPDETFAEIAAGFRRRTSATTTTLHDPDADGEADGQVEDTKTSPAATNAVRRPSQEEGVWPPAAQPVEDGLEATRREGPSSGARAASRKPRRGRSHKGAAGGMAAGASATLGVSLRGGALGAATVKRRRA